jgi:uncharacterized protein DUF2510
MTGTRFPAVSAIHLRCKVFPGAFLLYLCKPRVSIDHGPEQICRWGEQAIPVAPGRHLVRAWYNYITGPTNIGEVVVDVAPDQPVPIVYKTRWLVFLPGKVEVVGVPPQYAQTQAQPYGPAQQYAQTQAQPYGPAQQYAQTQAQPYAPAQPQPQVAAGWHRDPSGRHEHRWWDGRQWTPSVADGGATSTDPL